MMKFRGPIPQFSIYITLEYTGEIFFTGYSLYLKIKLLFLNKGIIRYY